MPSEPKPPAVTELRPAFDYVVAYAALHETVRRFLGGEANAKYLRRRFGDIEDDLQRALKVGRGEGPTE